MCYLDLLILIPELFFINFVLIFLWVGLYLRHKFLSSCFTSSFNYYSVFLILIALTLLLNTNFNSATALSGVFTISEFENILKVFTLFISALVILSINENEKRLADLGVSVEVTAIRLIIISAALLLISVNDIIYLFFIIELYSLASYILVGYRGKISVFSGEAALKYFLLGTIFSILMCYAFAIIYFTTGLTNFNLLEIYLSISPTSAFVWNSYDIIYPAITLLLITFFFKLAAAPFHFWAPDVYDGAPISTMYFLSIVPKIALLAILLKLSFLWSNNSTSFYIILLAAILSLVVGSLGGLFQKKIKRLLTYSMINNNGFFLLALAASTPYSFTFMIFYLFIYMFSLLGLFTSLNSLRLQNTLSSLKNIWSWVNLFFISKTQTLAMGLLLFSSAGIPPLVGFLSKFFILFSLISIFTNLHYLLILVLILAPLSCFYYIRIIKIMSFNKKSFWLFLKPPSFFSAYLISLMTISLFLLFLTSGLILNTALLLFI